MHVYFNFEREILKSMKILVVLIELLNQHASHTPTCMHVQGKSHQSHKSTQHTYL